MNDKIVIRLVVKDDYPRGKALWDGYNAVLTGRHGATELPRLEITQMTWSRFFDGCEPMQAPCSREFGGLLGLCALSVPRSTIQIGPTCYLQDLFTAEEAGQRCVGDALIDLGSRVRSGKAGSPRVYCRWQTHERTRWSPCGLR